MKYKNRLKIEQNESVVDFEFTTDTPIPNYLKYYLIKNSSISIEITTKYEGYLEDILFATLKAKEGKVINEDEHVIRELFMSYEFLGYMNLPASIRNNKQFYLQRAQLIDHPEFKVYADLDFATNQLKDDEEFVLELMKYNYKAYIYASSRVKAIPSVLNEFIKRASKDEILCLPKDNRITIAYERCKINPHYSKCFGEPLKRRLNGMNIIDYVDSLNLHKSLKKNLAKKQAVARIKI